jgi:hypothetical protein
VTSETFDVYLQPLVDEFLQLWRGIPAYYITKDVGSRCFILRGMLLWTIHDFPGTGLLVDFPIRDMLYAHRAGPSWAPNIPYSLENKRMRGRDGGCLHSMHTRGSICKTISMASTKIVPSEESSCRRTTPACY